MYVCILFMWICVFQDMILFTDCSCLYIFFMWWICTNEQYIHCITWCAYHVYILFVQSGASRNFEVWKANADSIAENEKEREVTSMYVCLYVCMYALRWCVGVYAYSIALNPIHELEVYVCTVCLCFAIIVLNMFVCMYVCMYVCM